MLLQKLNNPLFQGILRRYSIRLLHLQKILWLDKVENSITSEDLENQSSEINSILDRFHLNKDKILEDNRKDTLLIES